MLNVSTGLMPSKVRLSCCEMQQPVYAGEYPSMDDWVMHLTTIFPEIRLKKFIEMRGADGGPQEMIVALSALWVGLLYNG